MPSALPAEALCPCQESDKEPPQIPEGWPHSQEPSWGDVCCDTQNGWAGTRGELRDGVSVGVAGLAGGWEVRLCDGGRDDKGEKSFPFPPQSHMAPRFSSASAN